MFAVTAGTKKINDVKFGTFSRNIRHVNADVDVEAGTTGFRGYVPRGKSARTFVAIENNHGDFFFEPIEDGDGTVTGIRIACCGDGALMALVDALRFAEKAIIEQCKGEDGMFCWR